ncbi:MAG: segregation/condensation protein A [Candidatus Harrisonbacteria bacterium]|nr:segregation/condensation protein A [Candidatus Harrisonbacteria bacterium]
MFEIKTEQFTGPLNKLLELIETRRLEVTAIALAEVTEDFLAYIKSLQRVGSDILADFIVVASRLVLIKSKALLPDLPLTADEEEQIHDLESRLVIYREFRAAGAAVTRAFKEVPQSFSRELLRGAPRIFYPSPSLTTFVLHDAMQKLFSALEAFLPKDERYVSRALVTIEEKMRELMERFARASTHSFRTLAAKQSRSDVIALFLAILHLMRQKNIAAEQKTPFDDIMITT